ncbi:hypothetical protein [Natronococcus sp.]|uniref:hypothetical protein n=1 Tax=Natronococcus sp. TaxID=35747 RepID=UPI003A4D9497
MPPLVTDYQALSDALQLVLSQAAFADRAEAEALLELSKGVDPDGVPTFRPYVVLAALYEARPLPVRALTGASGASLEYTDPADARAGYLRQQARLDASLELEVPAAWPATAGISFASGF